MGGAVFTIYVLPPLIESLLPQISIIYALGAISPIAQAGLEHVTFHVSSFRELELQAHLTMPSLHIPGNGTRALCMLSKHTPAEPHPCLL